MNGIEALQALKEGKAIRATNWDEGAYLKATYKDGTWVVFDDNDEKNVALIEWFLDDDDDWEVLEGPLPISKTQWDYWVPVSETEAKRMVFFADDPSLPKDATAIWGTRKVVVVYEEKEVKANDSQPL